MQSGYRCFGFLSLLSGMALLAALMADASAEALSGQAPAGKDVVLHIDGSITRSNSRHGLLLDLITIQQLSPRVLNTSTVVTDGVKRFDGVLMRDLLALAGAQGKVVQAQALNGYIVDIPMADFHDHDVLLATHMDGVRLLPSGKGPLWIVYPRDQRRQLQDIRYDYRWVWQLHRLTVK